MTYTEADLSDWIDGSVTPPSEGVWLGEWWSRSCRLRRLAVFRNGQWRYGSPQWEDIPMAEGVALALREYCGPRGGHILRPPFRYRGLRFDPKAGA